MSPQVKTRWRSWSTRLLIILYDFGSSIITADDPRFHRRHRSLLGSPVSADVVLATTSDVGEVAQAALYLKIGMLATLKREIKT